jgi:hypothetical protein
LNEALSNDKNGANKPCFYGDICHASGVQRELCNQMFQSNTEIAGFAGLKWMYEGAEPSKMFQ